MIESRLLSETSEDRTSDQLFIRSRPPKIELAKQRLERANFYYYRLQRKAASVLSGDMALRKELKDKMKEFHEKRSKF